MRKPSFGAADDIIDLAGARRSLERRRTSSGFHGRRDFHWEQHRPVDIQEFLSSEVGRIEYWDQKLQAWPSFRSARPNETHAAVYHLERAGKLEMVVTQNIDGLHSQAGTSPEKLVELHGTNGRIVCLTCGELSDPVLCQNSALLK